MNRINPKSKISDRINFKYLNDPKSTYLMISKLESYYRDMAFVMDQNGSLDEFDLYSSMSFLCGEIKELLFPKNLIVFLPHANADELFNILIQLEEKHLKENRHLSVLCSELRNRFLTAEIQ